jgi:type IV secretion system protein VirB9
MRAFAALMIACLAAPPAHAQQDAGTQRQHAQSAPADSRIRLIPYGENSIISLRGHLGYQMLIEFDQAERIENVAIGDSLAWQVTPNRAATMLFLKPVISGAATNMTVVTTLRIYSFELRAQQATSPSDPNIIYVVRFSYPDARAPEAETPHPLAPQVRNSSYSLHGDGFRAVRVFDDGAMTYFQFPENAETPAIFAIGENGEEELVNTQTRAPYVVVDQLARAFVLRSGRHQLRVSNDGFGRVTTPAPAEREGSRP